MFVFAVAFRDHGLNCTHIEFFLAQGENDARAQATGLRITGKFNPWEIQAVVAVPAIQTTT